MSNPEVIFWVSLLALLYSHFIYPIVLGCLAFAFRRQADAQWSDASLPSVDIIIPAYNEEAMIERKIINTLELDYPPDKIRIIVASDGSSDRTVEIVNDLEQHRVMLLAFAERRGKPTVVRDAIASTCGEVLCLCDANVLFNRDALRSLVRPLADAGIGAVSGDVRLRSNSSIEQGERLYYRFERLLQQLESRVGSIMGADGGMYAIRRGLYEPPPADTLNDDFWISMKAVCQGKRVIYEPGAIAYEDGSSTISDEFSRRVRLSAGAVQLLRRGVRWRPFLRPLVLWKFISHKLIRWLSPVLLVVVLVSSAALLTTSRIYWFFLVVQLILYSAACVVGVVRRGPIFSLCSVPYYFVMSQIAMGIGLYQGLRGRYTVRWKMDRGPVRAER